MSFLKSVLKTGEKHFAEIDRLIEEKKNDPDHLAKKAKWNEERRLRINKVIDDAMVEFNTIHEKLRVGFDTMEIEEAAELMARLNVLNCTIESNGGKKLDTEF